MVHRDELAGERPEPLDLALAHGQRVRLDPVLAELGLDQGQRERRPDQREVGPLAQEVRDAADVVLVPVGQDDCLDVVDAVAR